MKTLLLPLFLILVFSTMVLPQPVITSFTPTSGPIGTSVTISGTGFSSTAANNIVSFGATRATVTAATATQLTVNVPTGATYQPITVLVNGLVAYSRLPFSTTYPGWGVVDATSFVPKVDRPTGTYPKTVAIGDLDGDGKADLVVANRNTFNVSVIRNTSTAGTISYAEKIDLPVDQESVAIGDLDGDGKLDIVAVNRNNLSILRNTSTLGTISYAVKIDFPAGVNSNSVAIGDLDGDGKADLAVTSTNENKVSVFRNTSTSGAISYATKVDFPTRNFPISVAIGDLDGDGKADLALANYLSNEVSVLRNTSTLGTISYAAKVDYLTGSGSVSVAIGDLDGDGKADLAVANSNSYNVSVLRNTSTSGTISYVANGNYGTGVTPISVAIGDLDGDGKADLAVANSNSNNVSVFRNASTSGTITYAAKVDYPTGSGPISVAIGDLDGDGKADLAVANFGSGNVSVFRHELLYYQTISFGELPNKLLGDVPFAVTPVSSSGLPVTCTSDNPMVATVSGNIVTIVASGRARITASQPGNTVYLTAANVTQTLVVGPPPIILSFAPTSGPVGTSVTINGTGFSPTAASNIVFFGATQATVLTASATQLVVRVPIGATYHPITVLAGGIAYSKLPFSTTYPGWGIVNGTSFVPQVIPTTGFNPKSVAIGDLDGDGKADLAVAGGNSVSVLRNASTSGTISYAAKVDYPTGIGSISVAIGDLDGDGKADLAVTSTNENKVSVFRNTSTSGAISYATKVDFPTRNFPISVAIGDLDGDGKADLALANYLSNEVSVLRNTSTLGTISYAAKVDYLTGSGSVSVAIGDLDGDGKADLAVANNGSGNVSVLRNTSNPGTINFAVKADFQTGDSPIGVAIGDLDGDGKADLAVAIRNTNKVSILRNTSTPGSIGYAAKADFYAATGPSSIAIGDLDGDGKPDIAVAGDPGAYSAPHNQSTVSLHRNTSTLGAISYTTVSYYTGANSGSVAIGDLDGDAKSDLAVTNFGSQNVSVFRHESRSNQTITFNPLPISCINTAVNLSATASSGLSITYTSSNPAIASVAGNLVTTLAAGTVTITASQAGNGTYIPATATQSLIVNPLPIDGTIAASTNSICLGQSVTISSSGGVGTPYYYASTDGGNSWNAFFQGYVGSYSFNYTPTQVGTYRFHLRNGTSCGQCWQIGTCTTYPYVDVVVKPGPIDGNITANATSICLGQSVTISSSGGTGTPYYWASTNGGSSWNVFAGQYAGQSSFSFTPTSEGTYRFHLRNQTTCGFCWDSGNNGCPTFPYVDVVVNAIPSVYIAGDGATFCSGGSTALTAYGTAYSYYAWSTGEGGTRSINAYSSGTYSVTAYLNGCQSSAQATVYEQYCEPDPDPCSRYGICPCFDQFCPRKETPAGSEPSDDPNVSELSVFPNPAIGQVTVALPARVEVDTPVRFFDLLGRQQGNMNIPKGQWKVSVSLDQAAEGTYIVKVGRSGAYRKLVVKK